MTRWCDSDTVANGRRRADGHEDLRVLAAILERETKPSKQEKVA